MRVRHWGLAVQLALPALAMLGCGGGGAPVPLAPVAHFTMTPSSGAAGTVFLFDNSGSSDADAATAALRARWDWEGDGLFDTAYRPLQAATHAYEFAGVYHPTLEVLDTTGLVASLARTVTVAGLITLTPAQATVGMGDMLAFSAQVSGLPDGGVLWSASGGAIDPDGVYHAPDTPGVYTITATSTADAQLGGQATVTVEAGSIDVIID
jgi:PKD repeat protein